MTKKRAPRKGEGAPKGNQNAAKGVDKKLVSARVTLPVYERLAQRAAAAGHSVSAEAAQLLEEGS